MKLVKYFKNSVCNCILNVVVLMVTQFSCEFTTVTRLEIQEICCSPTKPSRCTDQIQTYIRERSDKYLAYKKTKILEKWRFISQHSLLLARYA